MTWPARPLIVLTALCCCVTLIGAGSADVDAGRAQAKKDIAAGVLAYKQPIPETFLLEWMRPDHEDKDLLEYYGALLHDRYGVRHDWVMFNAASPHGRARAAGYNGEMVPLIEKRFGAGVLDKTWKEACNVTAGHRAEYLRDRQAKGRQKPTTQTATTKATTQVAN